MEKSDKFRLPKKQIIILIILAAAVVAGILFYNWYSKEAQFFESHFFSGTMINGEDVSEETAEEVKQSIQEELNEYSLTFTDHEGRTSTITAADLDLTYDDDGEVEEILDSQNTSAWIFNNDKEASYTVSEGSSYNADKLGAWIASLPCLKDGKKSTDAYEVEKEDGYWEIVPETYGDEIDAGALADKITDAVNDGETSFILDTDELFIEPTIMADDQALTTDVEARNKAMDEYYAELARQQRIEEITEFITNLDLKLNSYIDKVYINEELLKGMLTEDGNGDPCISEKKFKKWVRQWAEDRGFTTNHNLFVTHGGRLMQVANGPLMGWKLDLEATVERAWKAVQRQESGVIHPVLVDDEGRLQTDYKYVEINIMKQTMYFYMNGEQILETPVVTGNVAAGMATPSNGVWYIDRMNLHYTMVGATYVAYCDYWMAFNGGIGIHDLASRTAYGGDIYLTNGSHGCVNTPYEMAQKIFENVEIGTRVVVHS